MRSLNPLSKSDRAQPPDVTTRDAISTIILLLTVHPHAPDSILFVQIWLAPDFVPEPTTDLNVTIDAINALIDGHNHLPGPRTNTFLHNSPVQRICISYVDLDGSVCNTILGELTLKDCM
jgi:hypothetical protein